MLWNNWDELQHIATNNKVFGCIWVRLKTRIPNLWQLAYGDNEIRNHDILPKWDGNSMGWMLGSRKRGAVT